MNKNELAIKVSKILSKPLTEVIPVINCAMDVVVSTIVEDEPFNTTNLGSFYLKSRKQSVGYDPYHKTHILKPEGKSLRFEPSASIRRQIRSRYDSGVVVAIKENESTSKVTETEEKTLVEV
jgi:nucleoid DNA-binding protein